MKHLYSLALLLMIGIFAMAQNTPGQRQQQDRPGMPPSQQPPTSDQSTAPMSNTGDVQKDIQTALQKEPTLANANIQVEVKGNNVELSGTVPTRDAKDNAEQIARAHSGGMEVKNNIKVSENRSPGPGQRPQ
jgi:osmotically-inducible protein OsmY